MKPLSWIGSSQDDLRSMPGGVRQAFGFALYLAQTGKKHENAKPLQGFGSAGVLEVVKNEQGGTYRAVYTVRLKKAIYVLHCFQKKSSSGRSTAKKDIDLIHARLARAIEIDKEKGHD
jgi:phage-related protein